MGQVGHTAVLDRAVRSDDSWTAIIPVKAFRSAKSRLERSHVPVDELARAFLQDVLAALHATAGVTEVLIATHDPEVEQVARAAGVRTVNDQDHAGINLAAATAAAARVPGNGVLVLVSDLPCITSNAVAAALSLAAQHPTSFVPDADGTGTSMWLSPSGAGLPSHFGEDSRRAHVAAGAVDLIAHHPQAAPDLLPARLDVDTESGMTRAREHGVGPHTAALLASAPG